MDQTLPQNDVRWLPDVWQDEVIPRLGLMPETFLAVVNGEWRLRALEVQLCLQEFEGCDESLSTGQIVKFGRCILFDDLRCLIARDGSVKRPPALPKAPPGAHLIVRYPIDVIGDSIEGVAAELVDCLDQDEEWINLQCYAWQSDIPMEFVTQGGRAFFRQVATA